MKRAFFFLAAAVFLLPLLGIAAFYGYENWAGVMAWSRAKAALRAAGEPLSIEALCPKPVPDSENMASAPIFKQLFTFYSPQRAHLNSLRLPPPADAAHGMTENPALTALARRFQADFSGDSGAAARVVLEGLAPMQSMLEAVRRAAERPDAVWPVKTDRGLALPFLAPLRRAAEVIAARATVAISEDDAAAALSDFRLTARLSRDTNRPPTLAGFAAEQAILGYAVNVVRDGLSRGVWTDSDLACIEQELSDFRVLDSFADSVRGERALFLASPEIASARAEQLFRFIDFRSEFSEWISRTLCRIAWDLRPSGWVDLDCASYAMFAQDWLGVVIRKGYLRPWALDDWNARQRAVRRNSAELFRTPVTAFAMATYTPAARIAAYTQTGVDLARVACALERYRLATGVLPRSVENLAPAWLDNIPRDAIGGSRYHYRLVNGDSFTLYGCGWNARDDGGSSANVNALIGPSSADDWVWQAGPPWRAQASSGPSNSSKTP